MELPSKLSCRLLPSSFLFHVFLLCLLFLSVESLTLGNETDRLALLAFKHEITQDPNGALNSWNNSLNFCQWLGVTCGRRHPQRVIALKLGDQGLVGPMSPHIANLTFLHEINLANNGFSGQLPPDMSGLFRLRSLNLSLNSYEGEIPANLTAHCPKLTSMNLSYNNFVGGVPYKFHSFSQLAYLDLWKNNLMGNIPTSLGNLSSLIYLDLGYNSLEGSIPYELGRLTSLDFLQLSVNNLSGMIPQPIYNLSSISTLSLAENQLHGSLPPDLGLSLPNLQWLLMDVNLLTGPIPVSFSNASRLSNLDFGYNSFSGLLPMNLGSLQDLNYLSFADNQLGSRGKSNDMIFLTSLTNCSSLEKLQLDTNYLSGALPDSIANLSTQFKRLTFGRNQIFGSIPSGIENLVGLKTLGMENNFLTGTIPVGLGKLNKLQLLTLNRNGLFGQIPSSLGNITHLLTLDLSTNKLQGHIPSSLENCGNLESIYLHHNSLTGTIPNQILKLSSLSMYLGLSYNSLTGPLASEVGNLKQLGRLYMSGNSLSGEIPDTLGNCLSLEYLYMDHNLFQGTIPSSLGSLKGIRELDLSHNNLSGKIPEYLEKFRGLEYLNLSFNDLEGEVPKEGIFQNASAISVHGNNKLCGGILELQLPACPLHIYNKRGKSHSLLVIISIASVVLFLIILSFFYITFYWKRKSGKNPLVMSPSVDPCLKLSYAELLRATNGFSLENLVGAGSYGYVYKGFLDQNETVVAVKVLNLQQHGATKSFNTECEALRNIRHRNLIRILTSCSSIDYQGNDFKALVFEYMPNGSLEMWLHQSGDGQHPLVNLTLIQRLNVAIDVACALDYLHHHGQTPLVHGDLKPSNVLLDDDMNAHVGDFGLARFIFEDTANHSNNQSSSLTIKGSIGYVAPGYGMGGKRSTHGDVYSYGILLLEMFTGKAPTNNLFTDGLTLDQFAKTALPDRVIEITDPQLISEEVQVVNNNNNENHTIMKNRIHDCVVSMFRIGISCCAESPRDRMQMGNVVTELHEIKKLYHGIGIHRDRKNRMPTLREGSSYLSNN
ncbi:receptor kinase-like protein Xa21 [Tasmannia lanceolata]|uniref:receptor kinase-like protein Xa21 n=1 Tax=Tasmannia lanceolata TaxID=3420 RepID=UPI004063FD11